MAIALSKPVFRPNYRNTARRKERPYRKGFLADRGGSSTRNHRHQGPRCTEAGHRAHLIRHAHQSAHLGIMVVKVGLSESWRLRHTPLLCLDHAPLGSWADGLAINRTATQPQVNRTATNTALRCRFRARLPTPPGPRSRTPARASRAGSRTRRRSSCAAARRTES